MAEMSFLYPEFIPVATCYTSLKITDKGLVDVDLFKIIPATEQTNMEDTCQ
jgi:adenine deaminase